MRLIRYVVLLFSGLLCTAVLHAQSGLQVLSATGTETVLRLELSGIDRATVQTPLGPAAVIGIDGGTPLLEKGAPDVPKYAAALQIPALGEMAVDILEAEYDDYPGVAVAPSKGNLKRNIDPAEVPYEYGLGYRRDAFFPGALAALQKPFVWRDTRGQSLWLFPVQYNAVQQVLRVYRTMTVRIYPSGHPGINELIAPTAAVKSRTFDELQRRLFVNARQRVESRGGGPVAPEKMLVIARDNLLEELEPLVVWKRQMGIHTAVAPLSATGASDAAGIYTFVKNYYAQHGITYLLLVGDGDAIPPEMREDGDFFACDNCFGYLEGDDHFPEVLVGRLHAATPEQLRIMVNRNLEYEKHPRTDLPDNWYATGMAACSNEGDGIGDDGQADWQHGNEWKAAHLADGYEQYWEFYDGSHGADSPTPGHVSADENGDPANTPLVNLMNSRGVSLYNYTGHGWEQGLSSGNFNTEAVAALRNRHRYPILIAVACSAGHFTGSECLGEAWQRAGDPATGEPWGGIAGFFSSDLQSWSPPMEGQDGMNQYLTDADGVQLRPTLAGMLAHGNARMIAAYADAGELMAGFWNPFAEPSTMPRTRLPQTITAAHAASVPFAATSLTVNCPVEGALVSLYWQNQTWAAATVENGQALLEFVPLNNVGELTVTVSQFNYLPWQSTLSVAPATVPVIAVQSFDPDDTAGGNGNRKADYGEKIDLKVMLQNVGSGQSKAITATLATDDPHIVLTSFAAASNGLNSGESATLDFGLQIREAIPNGYLATLYLTVWHDGTGVETTIPLPLYAPVLEAGAWSVDDSAQGNGNGRLESGETALLRIANINKGGSDSPGAVGTLTSSVSWLSVSNPATLGALPSAAGHQEAQFWVTAAPNAPISAMTSLHYQLQAGPYTAAKEIAPLVVNPILETFESNTFYTYNWLMSGNKPWQISPTNPYSGKYCARSGTITHNQKSVMEINLSVSAEGMVAFARRVSSEAGFDRLRFLIDDVEMGAWSGEVPWAEVSYPVSPGFHQLTWSYEKDDLLTAGTDRAWVDEIVLPPHQIVVQTQTPDNSAGLTATVFPNPARSNSTLYIDLPREQETAISILDHLGRTVQTLWPLHPLPAGPHRFDIDLNNAPNGLYFIEVLGNQYRTVLLLSKME